MKEIIVNSINGLTQKGNRDNNEDYIIFDKDSRFIILCDGMGGHGHGEVASQTVAQGVFNYLNGLNRTDYKSDDLQNALNTAVGQLTAADTFNDEKPMGTTIAVAILNSDNLLVGHVGDSRIYLFDDDGCLKYRSKDHSKVQEAVDAEILTEEEAFSNPHKNILTRCVMSGKECPKIDVQELVVGNNYRLLLCSDGITDALRDSEIQAILVNREIDDALKIIDTECQAKSKDNYSVVIADISKNVQTPTTHLSETDNSINIHDEIEINHPQKNDCITISKTIATFFLAGMVTFLIASFFLGYYSISKKVDMLQQLNIDLQLEVNQLKDSINTFKTIQTDTLNQQIPPQNGRIQQ